MKVSREVPACVLFVCTGSKCKKKGGKELYKALKGEVRHSVFRRQIQVIKTGCTDRCKFGPVVASMPSNEWHLEVGSLQGSQILATKIAELSSKA